MAAVPEVPPKSPFLSSIMDSDSANPEAPLANSERQALPTDSAEEQTATRNHKVRPAVPPKPKGLVVKSSLRPRSNTISFLSEKEPVRPKPPVTPRKIRPAAPPKPPRLSLADIPESDRNVAVPETEEPSPSNHTSPTESEFCDEEYDLTPYQISTDPPPPPSAPFIVSKLVTLPPNISHRPAARAMSQPQLHSPKRRGHSHNMGVVLTPRPAKHMTDLIDGYHKVQAKSLPLFKEMNLFEIAKKYAKFFPIKIQITEGHYGMSSKYSISTDDRFNLHFKKCMKQVTIQTYGEEYVVPLSTYIQFGLIYDPSNNLTVAMEGHRFRRVADLIDTSPLPRLVRVMTACSCSNGVFLDYNELLVIRKVKTQLFRGKSMLKVFSLLSMSKKLLPEEAIGNFTTRPICLKLDLTVILKHIRRPFPCKAMMYLDKEEEGVDNIDEEELPPKMFSWPVTLKEVRKQESLVATLEKSRQLIDIPLQGSIGAVKANIVPPNSPEDIHELFRSTQTFLHRFDVTQVDIYGEFNTESAYDAQNTLYRMVRGSEKGLGIKVVTPDALRKLQKESEWADDTDSFTSSTSGDPLYDHLPGQAPSEDEYEVLHQVRPVITVGGGGMDPLDRRTLIIDRALPIPTPRPKPTVLPRTRADTSYSGSGTFRYSRQAPSPTENFPLTKSGRSVSLVHLPTSSESALEENRDYLKSLSIAQVYPFHLHCTHFSQLSHMCRCRCCWTR